MNENKNKKPEKKNDEEKTKKKEKLATKKEAAVVRIEDEIEKKAKQTVEGLDNVHFTVRFRCRKISNTRGKRFPKKMAKYWQCEGFKTFEPALQGKHNNASLNLF